MKYNKLTLITLSLGLTLGSQAAVVLQNHYELGETGSIVSGNPQDSVGGAHFFNSVGGGPDVVTGGTGSPGSTAYVTTTAAGSEGNYNTPATMQPADFANFALDLWVRTDTTNLTQDKFIFLSNNSANSGSIKIGLDGDGEWHASYHGLAWVGNNGGAGQTAVADKWTRLTIIRHNSTSAFYIDEVKQTGTTAGAPTWGTADVHLAIQPGGASDFIGDLDDMRIWNFSSSDALGDVETAVFAVPEPSSTALLGLGGLALVLRRWK